MIEGLTQLERELLNYVEKLNASCEVSAMELRGLERRSTSQITQTLNGLADCVTLLVRSQSVLVDALQALHSASGTYPNLQEKLNESRLQLSRSINRMNGS